MSDQQTVLILQGGGALGAYQAGVYVALADSDIELDWVIGTSIGAINAAIITGNRPEHRVEKLRGFWDSLTQKSFPGFTDWLTLAPWMQGFRQTAETLDVFSNGVNGFFKPRGLEAIDVNAHVKLHEASLYDVTPLKATLEHFVDFDYLNNGSTRLAVCAVNVATAQLKVFDTNNPEDKPFTPEHIMASGALPPGFPPVIIKGCAYWDGGVYSNTPLEVFLGDNDRRDALCFMIDLWDPTEAEPKSIAEAAARAKTIQYASRAREQLKTRQKIQNLQRAIRRIAEAVPEVDRQKPPLQALIAQGCDHTINLVHLIMKALPEDHYFKDVDFSSAAVAMRWEAGQRDAKRALKHKAWLEPLPPHAGLIIHELPQE